MLTSGCTVGLESMVDVLLGQEVEDEVAIREHIETGCKDCIMRLMMLRMLLINDVSTINICLN